MASKFDKDYLAFIDEGYNLELEPSLTLVWEIGIPESSAPLLKALGSISSISLRALEFPKKKLVCFLFFGFPNRESEL